MARPVTPSSRRVRSAARRWLTALGQLAVRQGQAEWFGSPFHLFALAVGRPEGVAAAPRPVRPVDAVRGQALLAGTFALAGQVVHAGPGGDPFDQASPSRPFAQALHGMAWLGDLLALGEAGERAALRLVLDWRRTFGNWNSFSWDGEILERRTISMACGLRAIAARASEAEAALITELVARHGRQLLAIEAGPARAAERATAAALAGASLSGKAGERLLSRALARLDAALAQTVLADGGHATRAPQAGLELLLDLLALDDGLSQRGRPVPEEMARAIDRLSAALRVLTLPDGRLGCFQGGEAGRPETLAAARAATSAIAEPAEAQCRAPVSLGHSGYEKLLGRSLTVLADAGAPATGPWSTAACGQPLAIEICCGPDRLVTNCGWSPKAEAPPALRLTSAGSTLALGDRSAGAPLSGILARALGPRLERGATEVRVRRHETPEGVWLEMSHDGWTAAYGLRHERLLFTDLRADELRGEERLAPVGEPIGPARILPLAVHFHLGPDIKASLARDRRSVLLQGPSTAGWWLRNDAAEVAIEPSVHYEDGLARRSTQVVLRGQVPSASGGRLRWKLAAVAPARP